ncbi:hypothetical protein DEF23_09320 [Marinitenerispora sediminis]|uniref:Uncharacterized protein n=2 Tax=Marinitenerispora sediminis TaxID=1931232 RepID=A0A368T4V1_9ACTN|nr:hypothetical protein DEF28_01895 [Marinitenerispora sediminis]RCV58276.1 hypothetical protein DEF23_09320 [Marinitenerispora sediminis]RCV58498.1 hypothetical protein DEF24_13355 [Marinitenerispora sediminis]
MAAVGSCLALTAGCASSGADGEEADTAASAEPTPGAGGWEDGFPEDVEVIIELDQPAGAPQQEATDAFFQTYAALYQSAHGGGADRGFIDTWLQADSPSVEPLNQLLDDWAAAGAAPAGSIRLYDGLVGAYSAELVQIDFCVDQQYLKMKDLETGDVSELPNSPASSIATANAMYEVNDSGEWEAVAFGFSDVGDTPTNACVGEDAGAEEPESEGEPGDSGSEAAEDQVAS